MFVCVCVWVCVRKVKRQKKNRLNVTFCFCVTERNVCGSRICCSRHAPHAPTKAHFHQNAREIHLPFDVAVLVDPLSGLVLIFVWLFERTPSPTRLWTTEYVVRAVTVAAAATTDDAMLLCFAFGVRDAHIHLYAIPFHFDDVISFYLIFFVWFAFVSVFRALSAVPTLLVLLRKFTRCMFALY